jgi:hypothetical protein
LPAVGSLRRCAEAPTEICPAEGGVPRTSNSKSTTCPEKGGFPRTNCTAGGNKNQEKRFIALFRIYQRIMGEQRKICVECQVTKKKKRTREKKR